MKNSSFFPPTPDVQHLPTLFRRIQQGEIRVPAFQRGFVWRDAQIIELLESVYRGFPIGNLLFWSVKEALLRIEKTETFPFPDVPEKYPLKFLLDGLQRMTTLYGVFHWPDRAIPGRYNVIFDLEKEEFRTFETGLDTSKSIYLSSLFSPKDFLEAQRNLSSQSNSESLMEMAIRLHSVFQEYMIPTVTIEDRAVSDVVSIFERINSTGTTLNAVDFMRAVTWSQSFDLNTEVKTLSDHLERSNFFIEDETLVKALAVVCEKDPTPNGMLELRKIPADELSRSMQALRILADDARSFLYRHLAIESSDYLPYEGQLLVLIRFLQLGGQNRLEATEALTRWLWVTSFNEELRGKPDHYVVRMLDRVDKLVKGDLRALSTRLTITPEDLIERRFIRGKALSAAYACMFAKSKARSIVTGEVIPPELYMKEFSGKNFEGLLPIEVLSRSFDREFHSRKIFANTFLFTEDDLIAIGHRSAEEVIGDCIARHGEGADDILRSQFAHSSMLELLQQQSFNIFVSVRATLIYEAVSQIL